MFRRFIAVVAAPLVCVACTGGSPMPAGEAASPEPDAVMAEQPAPAPASSATVVGFFTVEQANRGRETFQQYCSECHTTSDFRGSEFEFAWRRQSAWDLFRTMSENMPEDFPGILPAKDYADIVAYVLELNRYESGLADLEPTEAALDVIPLGPGVSKSRSPNPQR